MNLEFGGSLLKLFWGSSVRRTSASRRHRAVRTSPAKQFLYFSMQEGTFGRNFCIAPREMTIPLPLLL